MAVTGADIRDAEGFTLLYRVCRRGDAAGAKALLAQGADPNARQPGSATCFLAAVLAADTAVAALLLEAKADPHACGPDLLTPLMRLALHHWGEEEAKACVMASWLLAHGADWQARDTEGGNKTAEELARRAGNGKVADVIARFAAQEVSDRRRKNLQKRYGGLWL